MKKQLLLICLIGLILAVTYQHAVEARRKINKPLDKLIKSIIRVIEEEESMSDSYILPSIAVADTAKALVGRCVNIIKGSTENGKPCFRTPFEFAAEAYKLVGKSNLPLDEDGYYESSSVKKVPRYGDFNYGDVLVTNGGNTVGIYVGDGKIVYAIKVNFVTKVEMTTISGFTSKRGFPTAFEVV